MIKIVSMGKSFPNLAVIKMIFETTLFNSERFTQVSFNFTLSCLYLDIAKDYSSSRTSFQHLYSCFLIWLQNHDVDYNYQVKMDNTS